MPLRFAPLFLPLSVAGRASLLTKAISERLRLEVAASDRPRALENPQDVLRGTPQPDERRLVVLVVDDEADMRNYVAQCIRAVNVPVERVLEAVDGMEALIWLAATPIDLVISDVVMPRLDGLELCARLHDDPELHHVPVLLVSGELGLQEVLRRTPTDAPVTFLQKPFNARTLHDAIVEALR